MVTIIGRFLLYKNTRGAYRWDKSVFTDIQPPDAFFAV